MGSDLVKSFSFRTCVNPKLEKKDSGETKIVYQSLTAKESLQGRSPCGEHVTWTMQHGFRSFGSS